MAEGTPEPGNNKEMPQKVRALRTFEADIQEALKKEQVSMAKIAMAEQARDPIGRAAQEANAASSRRRLIVSIVILLLLGIGGFIAYRIYLGNALVEEILLEQKPEALINAESEKDILFEGATRSALIATVQKEVASPLSISSVKYLYFKENTVSYLGTRRFLGLMDANLPDALARSLQADFGFGIHSFDGNHPFILLKIDLYESAVSGMFAWESDLAQKFMPLFNGRLLTTSENKPFKDGLIKNKDVRVLKNADDRLLLVYTFIDRDTLLITNSEFTVEEITKRVNDAKLRR